MHRADGDIIVAVIHFVAVCRAGVISEPEFCFVDLASDDETLILASDGVFEFMSDEEVVDIVCNGNAADAEEACSQVRQSKIHCAGELQVQNTVSFLSAACACGYNPSPGCPGSFLLLAEIMLPIADWHQITGCRLNALTGSLHDAACIEGTP